MSAPSDVPEPDSHPVHKRRPRYRGTHPRRFAEKYKELEPEKYPELVAHVRDRGQTPAGQHVSIMVDEVIGVLSPIPGERGVDATLGFGGHAHTLLERLAPDGRLLALDVDPIELAKTEARLRAMGHGPDAVLVRRTNFAGLQAVLAEVGWHDGADFLFADLGVSSMQIDDPARGFSFKLEGPLDMRMNPKRGLSAARWLERATIEKIVEALRDNSDEPHAERIARALARQRGEIETTSQLAQAVRTALGESLSSDEADLSVRRVFQALRIEVNDELGALEALLRQLPGCLRAGGRVALLTFHSGEDRRVKQAFEQGARDGTYANISPDVIRAGPDEQRANPRSKAAKLRWARRAD